MKIFVPMLLLAIVLVLSGCKKNNQIQQNQVQPPETQTSGDNDHTLEFKASFAVFTNGTFRVFSDPKYHNKSKDVYISAQNPNIVTVKNNGVTWQDFFGSLPMTLSSDCLTTGTGQKFCNDDESSLKFFINSVETKEALERPINPKDKLLISYGPIDAIVANELLAIPDI